MEVSDLGGSYAIRLHKKEKDFQSALFFVQAIKGRRWDSDHQIWIIPKNGFETIDHLTKTLQTQIQNRQVVQQLKTTPEQELPELDFDIDQLLKKIMFPFQKKGTAYCLRHDQVLIGDQQGLGKTIQAIGAVVSKGEWPGLVITKNSLRLNWEKEFLDWTDKRIMIFSNSIRHTWPHLFETGFFDVGIVNYDSLQKYFVKLIKSPPGESLRLHHIWFYQWINLFKWIIVDESHYVKDMATKRTKFTAGLCKGKKQVYLLSGTPALNHPMEVYTQICIMNKQQYFGDFKTFKNTFCGKKNRHNLPALNRLLKEHCYFRRIKSEVAPDLPAKTRQIILCEIDNREEYNRCEKDFKKFLESKLSLTKGMIDSKLRAEALVKMMELKKLAAVGKLPAVKEWVESMIEQDEKFVLFAFHKDIQEACTRMAPGITKLGSSISIEQREANKKSFQEDLSVTGIVCSISADSEGHTLTAASNVGMVELPWHFGKMEQMEDRIHRIGTKYPVTCTGFLGDNTIDRKVYDLIMEKKDMHDQITGTEEDIETRTIDKIINLFNPYIS